MSNEAKTPEASNAVAGQNDPLVMPEFTRGNRYVVAKRKDILRYLSESEESLLGFLLEKIEYGRKQDDRQTLRCVVIESDWPEYAPTWAAIEKRMLSDAAWNFVEQYADGGDICTDCRFSDQSGPGYGHTCDLGDKGEVTECPALPEYLYPEA